MIEHDPTRHTGETDGSGAEQQLPTDEQLRAFAAWREPHAYRPHLQIEDRARDPEHPTEAERLGVAYLNSVRFPEGFSFEDYFGYPDPREPATPPTPAESDEQPVTAVSDRPVPTDEELRAFAAWREPHAYRPHLQIEDRARDPEHPTEAERLGVAYLNSVRFPEGFSFEDYFGYPDPREPATPPTPAESDEQ